MSSIFVRSRPRTLALTALALAGRGFASAQLTTQPTPGQPLSSGTIGEFAIVGNSLVSAQQLFLGTLDKVYIMDKVENNPATINGHPAWASEYSTSKESGRTMNAITNTFCAGGNVLGNGTWVNFGGNQEVQQGGNSDGEQNGATGPYYDPDGGYSVRLLDPCDDESCEWVAAPPLTTRRWYPTVETLPDGRVIIIGGDQWGGYVNAAVQSNPTYEFWPPAPGAVPIHMHLLDTTLPVNLYPLTWLVPSGKLFMQLNYASAMFDYNTNTTTMLDDIPNAVRTYPASAATAMLPLRPSNNFTATVLFCGGNNLTSDQWTTNWDIAAYPASTSCVSISPDVSGSYTIEDAFPGTGRTMPAFVILPDGKLFFHGGASLGTAGYGNDSWAIGMSYANNPTLQPAIYDPTAAPGMRWSEEGLSPSTVPRMYHSTYTLLPDGSIFVAGSNPNADYNTSVKFPTEYRVERFYPSYYNEQRPEPVGLPTTLSYGGEYFNVSLSAEDLFGDIDNIANTEVAVIRTGFSTHVLSMGQRFVQLDATYTTLNDGSAVLHVSQLPPNPSVLAPGPALLFVIVNGIPSVGVQVMVGNGNIGQQSTSSVQPLPLSQLVATASPQQGKSAQTSSSTAPRFVASLLVGSYAILAASFAVLL